MHIWPTSFWLSFSGLDNRVKPSGVSESSFSVSPQIFYSGEENANAEPTAAGERFMALKAALVRLLASLEVVKRPPPEMRRSFVASSSEIRSGLHRCGRRGELCLLG